MDEKEILREKERYTFEDLTAITRILRSEGGCPWDRKQTHDSLIPCLSEEAGEVIGAIENRDMENLCEELGDLLFQVHDSQPHCAGGGIFYGGRRNRGRMPENDTPPSPCFRRRNGRFGRGGGCSCGERIKSVEKRKKP